jgi:hypothetical protein
MAATASDGIAQWFTGLRAFQSACIGTNVSNNLLTFANTTIATVLPTDAEKSNFVTRAVAATGFDDMAIADLTTYGTFEALLDNWNALVTRVAIYLQSVSASTLQSSASADFWGASLSVAFPGGSAGNVWTEAMHGLASAIPASCFSSNFQQQLNGTVDTGTKKISDLVPQIAGLG